MSADPPRDPQPHSPAQGRTASYVGRFAPSPTGPLHAGSLAAALASRLDALAHRGRWLLRIEDLDTPREAPGAAEAILHVLSRLGFAHDGEIVWQSRRDAAYREAFERLHASGLVYPCACTRREIADSVVHAGQRQHRGELVYPGTCRNGLPAGRSARAWRVRVDDAHIAWCDRSAGRFEEALAESVGDFVLRRADGPWAYQLAVVVDDAFQGVTDVVRGADLRDSTARQVYLQRLLRMPTPRYLHVPVVLDARGEKLSKQTGAAAIDPARGVAALNDALEFLGLGTVATGSLERFWTEATARWARS
ncbi:MAG: tRNA glutamyl-Q(34) synthetase GluQRS [Burkholderiales bacterium]|nr:tRNA glutamyl-Q(34) synthetase GluQRS [Burkholderiales bacterium]